MNTIGIKKELSNLFRKQYGVDPDRIEMIPRSGSNRIYFRYYTEKSSVIGAFNPDIQENIAFFRMTTHFQKKRINVPTLISISEDNQHYLITDLGDHSLFKLLTTSNDNQNLSTEAIQRLKEAVVQLVRIQTEGADGFNFSWCYPKEVFDARSVMWDLNYFKYAFLKPSGVLFDEEKLEDDFEILTNYLIDDDLSFFHYRDFQSRNILIYNNNLFFIDYQGGRRGPCLYDAASMLYQAKAAIPQEVREELFTTYLGELAKKRNIDQDKLRKRFPVFILFRILQTLGAYGYRGFFERKSHFLLSIPQALTNLNYLLEKEHFDINIPNLLEILKKLVQHYPLSNEQVADPQVLQVVITSFSFKNGYPSSNPEHGGGFIFDCRSLPNPGRMNEYKSLSALDKPVEDYLSKSNEVKLFIEKAYELVKGAANNYISRNFNYLSVGFGCTGGQHRSVYCAEKLAEKLKKLNNVEVRVYHREVQKF